jgi:hypothetical protein
VIRRGHPVSSRPLRHDDPGLQPERTLLACLLFLRWIPPFGLMALLPIMVSLVAAMLIQIGLNARYRKSAKGMTQERIPAPLREVAALGCTVIVLSVVAIIAVVSG